jgi:hypothetical protein
MRPVVVVPRFWVAAIPGIGADGVKFTEEFDGTFEIGRAI